MRPGDVAPMVVAVTLILVVGGTILLFPLARRLGKLLDVMTRERRQPDTSRELGELRDRLDTVLDRLALLEERQDFQESLLSSDGAQVTARRPPKSIQRPASEATARE